MGASGDAAGLLIEGAGLPLAGGGVLSCALRPGATPAGGREGQGGRGRGAVGGQGGRRRERRRPAGRGSGAGRAGERASGGAGGHAGEGQPDGGS